MTEKDARLVPLEPCKIELVINNSHFIGQLSPASSVPEAQAFIQKVRDQYPDASHHVPVFIIGHGNSLTLHTSDAGEPPGTAGRPALAVLQGSGLGNVAVVITRYFGGRKLGTGGLVKAYGDSVRELLKVVKIGKLVATTTVSLNCPYNLHDQVQHLVRQWQGEVISSEYGAGVSLVLRFKAEDLDGFFQQLTALSSGRLSLQVLNENEDAAVPVD